MTSLWEKDLRRWLERPLPSTQTGDLPASTKLYQALHAALVARESGNNETPDRVKLIIETKRPATRPALITSLQFPSFFQSPSRTQNTIPTIKSRVRELDAEIEAAKLLATDPGNYHTVWIPLKSIALNKRGPFTGSIHPVLGLQYTKFTPDGDKTAYFSKDALRKRMKRDVR